MMTSFYLMGLGIHNIIMYLDTRHIFLLVTLVFILASPTNITAETKRDYFWEGHSISETSLSMGFIYYISRYPKWLGASLILGGGLLNNEPKPGDEYRYLPPAIVDMVIYESDVGPDKRAEVFFVNAGVYFIGDFFYKTVIKSKKNNPSAMQLYPIITSNRYSLVITKQI